MKVFDDLFRNAHQYLDKKLQDVLSAQKDVIRAARISMGEPKPNYERFIPKSEFITSANRFSPKGVEWLYLAFSPKNSETNSNAERCALKECRANAGDRFAICNFAIKNMASTIMIVDLSVASEYNFDSINEELENMAQEIAKREMILFLMKALETGKLPEINTREIKPAIEKWVVYTYAKLLSEQIFLPITTEDKNIMYAPFQCLAQYFLSKGYGGIVYSSTVFPEGKNIVLFDKNVVYPYGDIREMIIPEDF